MPGEVRAELLLTPFIGAAFGDGVAQAPKLDVGASVGWMGTVIGVEVDVSHRPGFYGVTDVPDFLLGESSVTTVMFNGLVGVPFGGLGRLRPYGAAGAGWVRARIGGDSGFIRANEGSVGFNVGGGLLSMVTDHLGVRGDVRYFRSLRVLDGESEFFNLGNEKLSFWRATAGLTIRF
ncbi:MAG: outer membrane beta-barrel protein [Acidobacteria bacterium]|nr:outer membrane beta-barrel protein [Acidobacteriota bacterium]